MMTYFEIARSVRDFQYLVGWLMIIQPGTWYDDTIIDCAWRLVGSRLSGASAMQSFTIRLPLILCCPQDPYMTGPEHNFAWNTIPDMRGGLTQLTEVFEEFVVSNLQ